MIQTLRARTRALLLVLAYRLAYWRRRAYHLAGYCPACGNRVNYTPAGRAVCPACTQR
jgi:NADH pyrophosphatase NudC (nudix superfamily)